MPGNRPGDVAYFAEKRDEIRRALEAAGRDPDDFTLRSTARRGDDRRSAPHRPRGRAALRAAGANHVILGVPAAAGPDGLAAMARDVAEPLVNA